jgi:GH24 family phage-related lysozyme (muramidase)
MSTQPTAVRRQVVLSMAALVVTRGLAGCAKPAHISELPDKPPDGIFLERERAVLPQGEELRPLHPKGLALTKLSEGWVDHLYNDAAGYCTVGYGHLCYRSRCDGSTPAEYLRPVSEEAGTRLLLRDMEQAQIAVQLALPAHREILNDQQFSALCDFVFNVGGSNFRGSTLLKVVRAKQFDRVEGQLQRWVLAGGKPYKGLVVRREREIALFFDGQAPPRGLPRADEDLSPLDILPRQLI